MKKKLLSIALATLSTAALADPFYIDNKVDFGGTDTGQVNSTSTSLKTQLTYQYDSVSVVTDSAAPAGLSAGDPIVTNGGVAVGTVANNNVTGFTPNEVFGANSNNGYGTDWLLTFGFTNLSGVVQTYTPGSELTIAYGAGGTFNLYYLDTNPLTPGIGSAPTAAENFMNINVLGAVSTGQGVSLFGNVDFTGTSTAKLADGVTSVQTLFHSGSTTCGTDNSFFAIVTNCGIDQSIQFVADFNTDALNINIVDNGDGTLTLTGKHDGSARFDAKVAEPEMLALMGGAFLMFGAARRNKKA